MNLLVSTALLGLAWFAMATIVTSSVAWAVVRFGPRRARSAPALLALRLAPAALSLVVALGLFVPAHLALEPRGVRESFGTILIALALLSMVLVLRSATRAICVACASRRILATATRAVPGADHRTYEVTGSEGVSLAGVFRTRILIGSGVRAALTPAELDIAIAHEVAHRASFDNVKRFAMFCAPDLFGWSAQARRLETEWRAEAECLADARAVQGSETRAVLLASALVKVARLGSHPTAGQRPVVWSTFHEAALLEARVHRLVRGEALRVRPLRVRLAVPLLTAGVATVWAADVTYLLHHFTEFLVRVLP